MIFQNYHYEKPENPALEVGDYLCRIDSATDKTSNNGNVYVEVKLAIHDHPGANPNMIQLFDIPSKTDVKANGQPVTDDDIKKACQKLSKFLDCFGIDPKFASNLAAWKGHTGTCHCDWQYDPNEHDHKSKKYKQLFPMLPKKTEAEKTENVPASSGNEIGITEDIPF